ncbi:hypothetical protein BGW38_002669, partial [Lunasporangiospora selenospora]
AKLKKKDSRDRGKDKDRGKRKDRTKNKTKDRVSKRASSPSSRRTLRTSSSSSSKKHDKQKRKQDVEKGTGSSKPESRVTSEPSSSTSNRQSKDQNQRPLQHSDVDSDDDHFEEGPSSAVRSRHRQKEPKPAKDARNDKDEDDDEDEEEVNDEDPDHRLGLKPMLRVVSRATVRKSWVPVNIKTRTRIQKLVTGLFPLNDTLGELKVPPQKIDRGLHYENLTARNKELESMLVPELERIRELELRLEQEQKLVEQEEKQLETFNEKKRVLDTHTQYLQRNKLHPLLRSTSLSSTMDSLCRPDNDFGHLSVEDQRLLSMMPISREETMSGADIRESTYNPNQDLRINKTSKRLGNQLANIEQNGAVLDPLLQLVSVARDQLKTQNQLFASE